MPKIFEPMDRSNIASCIAYVRAHCRCEMYKIETEIVKREAAGERRDTSEDFNALCDKWEAQKLTVEYYDRLFNVFMDATV